MVWSQHKGCASVLLHFCGYNFFLIFNNFKISQQITQESVMTLKFLQDRMLEQCIGGAPKLALTQQITRNGGGSTESDTGGIRHLLMEILRILILVEILKIFGGGGQLLGGGYGSRGEVRTGTQRYQAAPSAGK